MHIAILGPLGEVKASPQSSLSCPSLPKPGTQVPEGRAYGMITAVGPWTKHFAKGNVAFWLAKLRSPAHSWFGGEAIFQSEGKGNVMGPGSDH